MFSAGSIVGGGGAGGGASACWALISMALLRWSHVAVAPVLRPPLAHGVVSPVIFARVAILWWCCSLVVDRSADCVVVFGVASSNNRQFAFADEVELLGWNFLDAAFSYAFAGAGVVVCYVDDLGAGGARHGGGCMAYWYLLRAVWLAYSASRRCVGGRAVLCREDASDVSQQAGFLVWGCENSNRTAYT